MEHRDMDSSYIVRVMHAGGAHVVLLHRRWLDAIVYADGRPFPELMQTKSLDECCRMVSRTLLGALRFKPDHIVVVVDGGDGPSMEAALQGARSLEAALAMGGNELGRRLSELCQGLADKGFFDDERAQKKYSPRWSCQ